MPAPTSEAGSNAPSRSLGSLQPGLLIEAAELLERCQADWDSPARDAQLVQTLRVNTELWDALAREFLRDDHPLPEPARRNLLCMSGFVHMRTLELLSQPSPESLQALIELDRNLAAGLLAAGETPRRAA